MSQPLTNDSQRTPDQQESIYAIALTRLSCMNIPVLREVYELLGSATTIVEHRKDIREVIPAASLQIVEAFRNMDDALMRAEAEYRWATDNKIQVLTLNDERYPQRMRDCHDAPSVLYYRGSADLNMQRVVSIIGTRHSTPYGHDVIRRFVSDLRQFCPEVLIVSGLAYGVDIHAHREALANGYPTVGVLAHGLDQIYPNAHRDTAIQMLNNGGLLTEYMSQTPGAKSNFVQRNRIVAGMCDACIIVESAQKGGGLITMRIAEDYNRDCFAFPGPVNAEYSKGCNNLIRDNKASLITSAEDFVKAMRWDNDKQLDSAKQEGIERELFPDLSPEEQKIVSVLRETNDLQVNVLTVRTGIPINKLSTYMFYLEMKGVVRTLAGGTYHLLY